MAEIETPVPPLNNGDRLTRAEFERIYSAHPEIKKAELIEGVVYMPSPARYREHGKPHFDAIVWIGTYIAATPGSEGSDNATLRLDLENEPQPDALLRLTPESGGGSSVGEDGYLEGAPELILEVSASSASYDLNQKKRVYARNGVPEYIVYLAYEKRVIWHILRDGVYEEQQPDKNGVLRGEQFPGLWLLPDALLAGDLSRMLKTLEQGLDSQEHKTFCAALARRRKEAK
ncbi:MAG: Uma2 family endonuclease [Caldilineaceae bacterium SB0661_bin_32]|uniref:Uma2 family endonuclease n=1 Tax=Caldilineaceae bacterium SB0661_bin_32 TaxID=2605255 RepID=A0A6B1D9P3_9CHLR|nr:Uma2 family endonuclease [Caldilineaceae bacterium SB0661_bin_32]